MEIISYKVLTRILLLPFLWTLCTMPGCFIARSMAINKLVREQEEYSGTLKPIRHDSEVWVLPEEHLFKVKTRLTFQETGNTPRSSLALLVTGYPITIDYIAINEMVPETQLETVSSQFEGLQRLWIYPPNNLQPGDIFHIDIQSTVKIDQEFAEMAISDTRIHAIPESFLIPYAWFQWEEPTMRGLCVPFQLTLHTPPRLVVTGYGKKTAQIITNDEVTTVFTADQPENWRFVAFKVDEPQKVNYTYGVIHGLIDVQIKQFERPYTMLLQNLSDFLNGYSEQFGSFPSLNEVYVVLHNNVSYFHSGIVDPNGHLYLAIQRFLLSSEEWENYGNLAHESAHLWFGHILPLRLHEPGGVVWIEGLAQYLALLEVEKKFGPEKANVILHGWAANCLNRRDGKKQLAVSVWEKENSGEELAYGKGMLFFYFLAERVGREKFMDSLRQLVQEYQGKGISIEELKQFFAKYFETTLDAYFERWFYQPGIPEEIKNFSAS